MRLDILNYVDNCQSCSENHGAVGRPVPIRSYPIPNEPWDTLAIDLLKLPLTTDGHQYLLAAIDHFSRFSILVPLKDKQATTVARALRGGSLGGDCLSMGCNAIYSEHSVC